jgi:HK97 family phage prohead protease
MTEMETRSFDIRSVDEEAREVSGIAVPYGQVINAGGYSESFERGAIDSIENVKLFWNHDEPIGRVVKGEDTDDGYVITASISKTSRGEEAYTLLKDGVVNRFSVGFIPVASRDEENTVVRTKVDLKEVSLVPFPAYEGATVSQVRAAVSNENKEDINMSTEVNQEVADLRGAVDDLERKIAVLSVREDEGNKVVHRSGGELLKALAAGDEEARSEVRFETRDFGTTVEADVTRPGWVNERMRMDLENRPTINAFSKGALPASGNSVEYPFVKTVSGTVAVQAAEGDALSYMEVALDTATAPVKTYGGYSSLSRQAIERSDLAYLQTVLEYQTRQYAKATEKAVRDALVAATGTNTATLAADDADGWIDAVVDAAAAIHDNSQGSEAEFGLASRDVFKRLAKMVDGAGRPLFNVSGQAVNSLGSSNLLAPALNVGGLTVVINPALAANTFYVAASDAVKTWESAGAPFRLQDENIINLTKDFALYGYLAVGVLNAKAITKVDVDLV